MHAYCVVVLPSARRSISIVHSCCNHDDKRCNCYINFTIFNSFVGPTKISAEKFEMNKIDESWWRVASNTSTRVRRYCCMKCEYVRLIFDATKCGRAQWGVIRFVRPQSAVATVVSIWNYYLTMRLILLYRCDCVRRRHSAQPLPVQYSVPKRQPEPNPWMSARVNAHAVIQKRTRANRER